MINFRNVGLFAGKGFRGGADHVCLPLPTLLVSLQEHSDVLDNISHDGPRYREISRRLQVKVPSIYT